MLDYDHMGRKVIIMRPGCFDPYLHKPEDVEKVNFMVSDVMGLDEEQMFLTGIVIIVDLEGYSLSHVTQRPLAVTKKHMHYLQVTMLCVRYLFHLIQLDSFGIIRESIILHFILLV